MARRKPKQLMDKAEGKASLLEIHCVLKDIVGIQHFLIQGTALGAYRDHGFTPTEVDIDIGFLWEDFHTKAHDIASALTVLGYVVEVFNRPFTKPRTVKAVKGTVKVDLVSWIPWKDKRFTANLDPAITYSLVHDKELMENYEEVIVFGTRFLVPCPIEEYLRREYDDWKTPRFDHRSRTRVAHFRDKEGIPNDFLDTLEESHV